MSTASSKSSQSSSVDYFDPWPEGFDGKSLLSLIIDGNPTGFRFDVAELVTLVHRELRSQVVDIPLVTMGVSNFGFRMVLSNGMTTLARIHRSDVNTPGYDALPFTFLFRSAQIEVAIYQHLKGHPGIPVPDLLFHRLPEQQNPDEPVILDGRHRQLFIFRAEEGETNIWNSLDEPGKTQLLVQLAEIRAALFQWKVPSKFSADWSHSLDPNPKGPFTFPVSPTRDYAHSFIEAKINETIRNEGDPIGWEKGGLFVGPRTAAAKRSLLRLLPAVLPPEGDDPQIYRLVLEHSDFGIHNMTIDLTANGPKVTSVFDWETAHVVPALLSNTEVWASRKLQADGQGGVRISPVSENNTPESTERFTIWARTYVDVLFNLAPDYERALRAGRDAMYIWTMFKQWREEDPEEYFGDLGSWADQRLLDLKMMSDSGCANKERTI